MVKICCPREKPMNDGLYIVHDWQYVTIKVHIHKWSLAKWLACCIIIISTSSSRHHKQLQHRTGCPKGLRKRCLSLYKSHSQTPFNWSGNETIIIQVSFPGLSIGLERNVQYIPQAFLLLFIQWLKDALNQVGHIQVANHVSIPLLAIQNTKLLSV